MAAKQGHQWNITPDKLIQLVRGVTDSMLDIRNDFKKLRDQPNYIYNKWPNSAQFYIQYSEDLFHLADSNRRQYSKDDKANEDKQTKQMIERYEKKIAQLTQALHEEQKAKNDAISRVSEMASRLLKEGNPAITELSDPNRPLKIAEQFNSLYDNEWTDAYENLAETNKMKEFDAIDMLYKMLEVCNQICCEASRSHYSQCEDVIAKPRLLGTQFEQGSKGGSVMNTERTGFAKTVGAAPSNLEKPLQDKNDPQSVGQVNLEPAIMDFRKLVATEVWKNVRSVDIIEILKRTAKFPDGILKVPDVEKYILQCARLCWLMGAHVPPMVMELGTHPGSKFNSDIFKEYRTRGTTIAHVAWPPVYLHKDGPVLCKGYAECAPASEKEDRMVMPRSKNK